MAAELWAEAAARFDAVALRARAASAARRAAATLGRCEGARTEPLGRLSTPVALSRRQRETAALAARGASNAEIAATLSISERPVESHLYAVFAKLGVTQRGELAEALESQ